MNICTCIIPFYNEGERVLKVLDEVIKIKEIDETVCIDDGSTDNTSELIEKRYFNIKIIKNPKNLGKTEAVKIALNKAKDGLILLLDADLRNFSYKEIEVAVNKMKSNNSIDMIILRRINAPIIIKINRGDILTSGERILKKEDLRKIIDKLRPKGYELEYAINLYMMENKKNVFWLPSSALNTYLIYKRGFIKGLGKIISMQVEILKYIGLKDFIKQELFFCRKKLI